MAIHAWWIGRSLGTPQPLAKEARTMAKSVGRAALSDHAADS